MKGLVIILFAFTNVIFCNDELKCGEGQHKAYEPFQTIDANAPVTYYYICLSDKGEAVKKDCPDGYEFVKSSFGCSLQPSGANPTENSPCTTPGQLVYVEGCNSYLECKADQTNSIHKYISNNCQKGIFSKFLLKCLEDGEVCDENEKPNCDLSFYKDDNLRSLTDCQSFYKCDNGMRLKFSCPSGQNFDPTSQVCRDAKVTPCSTSSSTSGVNINAICKGKATKFVADPNYCKGYYYCIDEKTPFWGFCADNKYFNNGACITTRPSTCSCEDVSFKTPGEAVYVASSDKTKFYLCKKGLQPVEKQCPQGMVFDESEEECV